VIDVLVAGGGPAGLATAIRCAQAGLSVTVAEPRTGPVDKACGEGLMPAAVARLADIGVRPDGYPLRGIRYVDASRRADALFRGCHGLGVRRTTLHTALAVRAGELSVPVLPVRVTSFTQDDRGVTAIVRAGTGAAADEVRARYLVAADGLHSALRKACGLAPPPARHPRFGLRRHYRIEPWTDLVEVYWAAEAEAYVTPVAAGLVGVAVLGSRQPSRGGQDGSGRPDDPSDGGAGALGSGFEARLTAFPALVDRLDGAIPASDARGAGPLRQDVTRRTSGRVLLVGDASGYQDALTGEGIGAALAHTEVLAACVAADRPGDYERAWRRVSRKSRLLTGTLLWSRHQPLLASRVVPAAQRLPWLFTAIVNQVGQA
jgi:flavin-dependent dehydrogenase